MPRPKSQLEKDYNTKDTSARCGGDLRLRRHGFRIKNRPSGRSAVWEKQNDAGQWVEYTEARAHRYADVKEEAVAGVGQ